MQSPAAYTPRALVRETRSTITKPASSTSTSAVSRPSARGVGDRADGQDAVGALDGAAVGERDGHGVAVARHRRHPGARQHVHPTSGEHVLEDAGGVGVLAGQHAVAARDERDPAAECEVGAGELRARHARAHDDQVLRQLGRGRRPAPRSGSARRPAAPRQRCAATRRWRAVRRRRTARSSPSAGVDDHGVRPVEPAAPRTTVTPSFSSRSPMSSLWSRASCLTRALTRARST